MTVKVDVYFTPGVSPVIVTRLPAGFTDLSMALILSQSDLVVTEYVIVVLGILKEFQLRDTDSVVESPLLPPKLILETENKSMKFKQTSFNNTKIPKE